MSSGQNVSITLTVDEAAALKSWTSQQTAVETLKKRLATLELKKDPLAPLKAGAMSAVGTLGSCIVAVTGIGGAISGVMMLARQLKAEYENLKSRQAAASGAQAEYAMELAPAIRATAGKIKAPELEQLILQGSQQTGQTPATVTRAINAAFTAKGPNNAQDARDRIEEAVATLGQYEEQDSKTLGDITAVTSQNKLAFGLNTQQALGFQQKAQNVSAVKDVASFATNVGNALPGIAISGDTSAAEAGALTGTLSQVGGDREGSLSTTAARTMVQEVKERLPHLPDWKTRLKYMQEHPELTKAYQEGGNFPDGAGGTKHFPAAESGRGAYKAHVLKMFDPTSQHATEYQKNLSEFGTKEDWEKDAENSRKEVASAPSIQLAKAKRAGDNSEQQLQIDDTAGAAAAIARDTLVKNLKAVHELELSQQLAGIRFEANAGIGTTNSPLTEVANQVGEKAGLLEERAQGVELVDDGFGNEYYRETNRTEEQKEEDRTKAKRLRDLEKSLRTIDVDLAAANVNKKAESGVSVATEAVVQFEQSATRTPEELQAARKKIEESYPAVKAAEKQDRDKKDGGEGRKRLERFQELEKRLKAAEAAKPPGVKVEPKEEKPVPVAEKQNVPVAPVVNVANKPEPPAGPPLTAKEALENAKKAAKQSLADAEKAAEELANDTTPTEEELHDARQKAKRAGKAVNEYGQESLGELGGGGAAEMFDSFRKLNERLDALARALDANSKATENNNKATNENTKAAIAPPAPSTVPVRNNTVTQQQSKPK